jgi:beta-mannanase
MLSQMTTTTPNRPLVGLYEPIATTLQSHPLGVEVLFLDWNDRKAVPQLKAFLTKATERQRLPLLTLEPFADRAAGRSNADLLGDVLAGRHDEAITSISQILAAHPGRVLLRFGHEMDIAGQYPWSFRDPDRYIQLYRTVFEKVAAQGPTNLHWVWSPAGRPGADRYWPGDGYVNVIGISIYASRAWMPDRSLQSFPEQLEQKRWLQRRFGGPLLVAEAGVSGTAVEQQQWIQEALGSLDRFPEVCGVVYFQAPQPAWMPLSTGPENWQLKAEPLRWLLDQLPLPARRGLPCVQA